MFEERTEDSLKELQSKQDINTKIYFNGKLLDGSPDLFITATDEENPNTLDNISSSLVLAILSLVGLITTTAILRKKVRAN